MARRPWYVPEFRVMIDRREVPDALRASISSVSHQTGMEGADRVELAVNNEALRWLDHPTVQIGKPLELQLGYAPDPLVTMFVGEVVSVEASFPGSGLPMLNVAAQDGRSRLQKGTQNRWFATPLPATNGPRDEQATATRVAAENRLVARFDPAGSAVQVIGKALKTALAAQAVVTDPAAAQRAIDKQVRLADYDLLKKLAHEGGYDLFVDHTGPLAGNILLFFSPLLHLQSEVTLRYGASLIEFTPRVSDVGQLRSVAANVWDSGKKASISIVLSWDGVKKGMRLTIQPGKAKAGDKESDLLISEPLTLATAPRRLFSELMNRLNQRQTGAGSAVGDPRIRTGAVLRLEGVGAQFGGFYRVTSARHRLDSGGYRTSFECRKEVWFDSIPDVSQGALRVTVARPALKAGRH